MEIIFASIIISLIVDRWYLTKKYTEQNEKYMKALIAKNLTDYATSAIIEKDKPEPQKEPEFIPAEQMDESLFSKAINNILKKDNGGQSTDE